MDKTPIYSEPGTVAIASAAQDLTITLAKAAVKTLQRVRLSLPGETAAWSVIFYDDAPTTTPISGELYGAAQPAEGFEVRRELVSGKLGVRIKNATSGITAYATVEYTG
jgi:hypothetical protein